jgi:hypothetical protein
MLIVHTATDPHSIYSHYLAEILRLEGFADFGEADIARLAFTDLAAHDLILLPRFIPTAEQAEMLTSYVRQGGRLIAFLPAANLVQRLGLAPKHAGIHGGYLRLDSAQLGVQGLCPAPVQVITPTVAWSPATDAQIRVLAHVRPGRDPAAGDAIPGVAQTRVGQGEAILFAYDLPHTVARLRQGNPENSDLCFAGLDGIYRPSELFVGQLAVEQMPLPQADIHTALLARAIELLAPRPRLWYYSEAGQRSVVIMTSDDDWSTLEQFDALLAGLRQRQAHCTFFIVPETRVRRGLMDAWEAEGHTFSVHPAVEGDIRRGLAKEELQRNFVSPMLADNVARHQAQFGRAPRTIRQHAVRWLGYVEAARLLAGLGVEMDLNYISVHPFSLGYMCGSGRPLPFVDVNGDLIPCYQQPSLWTEEVLIHPEFVFSFKWSVERALAETGAIIRRAAREFYTPITFNSHPVSFATYSSPLIEGCWDTALAEGMAILSADEWLNWTQARNRARLEVDEDGCTLITPDALPAATLLSSRRVHAEARGCELSQQRLWGQEYTAITLRGLAAGERRRIRFVS